MISNQNLRLQSHHPFSSFWSVLSEFHGFMLSSRFSLFDPILACLSRQNVKNEPVEAEKHFQRAIVEDPCRADVLTNYGLLKEDVWQDLENAKV